MTKTFPNDIQNVDVVVLGAGPAGVAAAKAASQEGAKVIIIDENASAGGQIYRAPPNEFQPNNSFKSPEFQEGEKMWDGNRAGISNANNKNLKEFLYPSKFLK